MSTTAMQDSSNKIAVIGMAGRFPGARDVYEFWRNLEQGVESVRFFSKEELLAAGEDPTLLDDPNYVAANGYLDGIEEFDAPFFGFTPREAEITDPQHRLFLECVWNALEDAGYDSSRFDGRIGVFGGAGPSSYLIHNLLARPDAIQNVDRFNLLMGNNKDYVPTRASYKLNLTGPSLNVNTACSSSLTAVHLACQSLMDYQCDIAVAGGVGIQVPQRGYLYEENAILSPDGHCRAFDADAQGTVSGNGVALVVLKRLDDALQDRDSVRAVVLGSAINNDGAAKVGFTAPSVEGQTEVIAEALAVAEVEPDSIQYIETHGTGTRLGDPIEIAALRAAFREAEGKGAFCAIGSVKTNVGHLDEAAGGAGLIKTVMALEHGVIPPSLHFQKPNSQIDFDGGPFFVADKRAEWKTDGAPRRASVSSFGIGGTNVHIVLEEPPVVEPTPTNRRWQLLTLSARSQAALEQYSQSLAEHLSQNSSTSLADAAYTLQVGRKPFLQRRVVCAQNAQDAMAALRGDDVRRVVSSEALAGGRRVAFLFTGQGSQYENMGLELYQGEEAFRDAVDQCVALLRPHLKADLRAVMYPALFASENKNIDIHQTAWAQPGLFTVSYALTQLWASWGVEAECALGHSIGEYAAACWAGVFSLEDALAVVALRGRLMQSAAPGAMLAASTPEETLQPILTGSLCIAAVNAPDQCVVSGVEDEIERFKQLLETNNVQCAKLRTSHAFHSNMMEPILDEFRDYLKSVSLHEPQRPFISNLSGDWTTNQQATSPDYWAAHLRNPVRFADGVRLLCQDAKRALVELGPGNTLSALAMQSDDCEDRVCVASMPRAKDAQSDTGVIHKTLGSLWASGVEVDWQGYQCQETRGRIPLPTYPFERQRYWIDAPTKSGAVSPVQKNEEIRKPFSQWFYQPVWKPAPAAAALKTQQRYVLFTNKSPLLIDIEKQLAASGPPPICVVQGEAFEQAGESAYALRHDQPEHFDLLFNALDERGLLPDCIVYAWGMGQAREDNTLYAPIWMTQALGRMRKAKALSIVYLTQDAFRVQSETIAAPEQALMLGPALTAPLEYETLSCRVIDVERGHADANALLDEFRVDETAPVAYRDNQRWKRSVDPTPQAKIEKLSIRPDGAYLISGGLGGVGLAMAERLAQKGAGALALITRSEFPERSAWDELLRDAPHSKNAKTIQTIRAIEQTGARVSLYAVDVSDAMSLKKIVDEFQTQAGAVRGVIHAAGVADGEMIQRRSRDSIHSVVAAKVDGAKALASALDLRSLDFCVFCSALSADIGSVGQVAYIAANSYLNAFAQQQRAQGANVTAIHWDAWREAGMAVEASLKSKIKTHGSDGLFQPIDEANAIVYAARIHPDQDWIVNEHRIEGQSVAPGTAYLEWVREAFQHCTGEAAYAFSDVYFLNPMIMDFEREARVLFDANHSPYEFQVVSRKSGEDDWTVHAQGCVEALRDTASGRLDLSGVQSAEDEVGLRNINDHLKAFGPHWHCVEWVKADGDAALAKLRLPDSYAAELAAQSLHPALLDVATGICVLRDGFLDGLPFSYQQIRVYAPLTQTLYSRARLIKNEESEIAFDVSLYDGDGALLVEIENYTLKRVQQESKTYQQLQSTNEASAYENYQLDITAPGDLETLALRPSKRSAPAPGEIEICVEAAGLNFKEVMYAYGMFAEAEGFKLPLGLECAGTVTAVGDGVASFKTGDRVAAFATACFQRYVTVAAERAARLPDGVSFEEGASIPAAFLTAYYALRKLARLQAGERVLIHAAAGGVGMAAVKIAQQIGAEIFATAGSDDKRAYLKTLSVAHVMNSRTAEFADEIQQITSGEGVDVVLNSLSGELMEKSFETLAPFGRFLEIGVRDIYQNAQLGLAPFQKCLSYFAVGVGPDTPGFAGAFQELMQEFADGRLQPSPHKTYSAQQARDAFAFMAKAKHIGKLVIQFAPLDSVELETVEPKQRSQSWEKLVERFARTDDAGSEDASLALGLSNREGQDVFEYALSLNAAELIVSTTDFHQRMNIDRTVHGASGAGPDVVDSKNDVSLLNAHDAVEAIWKEFLGVRSVSDADNFYELGGDSLLAAQILTRLRKALRVNIPLSAFLEDPTFGGLRSLAQPEHEGAMEDAAEEMEEGVI
ncbi:MAG: SDR family NAD(P)-dependent oxidoreductase [Candidatus Hinthialibacter antarcticus]|nr:SDR family NAD(P)-dependent oxidoreductase [Candidatus Hinthialibacter antarcticus]